jgi:hypothetical protein
MYALGSWLQKGAKTWFLFYTLLTVIRFVGAFSARNEPAFVKDLAYQAFDRNLAYYIVFAVIPCSIAYPIGRLLTRGKR